MSILRAHMLIPAASLVISAALAGAWLVEPWIGDVPGVAQWLLVVCACSAAAAAVWSAVRTAREQQRSTRRFFELLCRLDSDASAPDGQIPELPAFGPHDPARELFQRVRECLVNHAERVRHAEHVRTATEVRGRRVVQRLEHLESIFASLPEPVLVIDQFDEVVLTNPSAEKFLTSPLATAESRAATQLVRSAALVELVQAQRKRRGRGVRGGELQLADEQGTPRWYQATLAHFGPELLTDSTARGALTSTTVTSGAAVGGTVVMLRDISGLKAIQKRNAEFVSAVSHEMKAPLAGIKAYVELLADGEAEDESTREEFLDVINTQADRLQRLIDNLLNLARIEAGVVSVNKKQQSLNDILEEAARIVLPAAQQKEITLTTDLSGLHLAVSVDRDMLLQATINLLSNAVKYTPTSGAVTLRSRLEGNKAVVEVEDSGVGLTAEDCQRVFEKFYRVKKDQGMAPGTGLGLPLAKHIVEEVHAGMLTVTSEPGAGSTFTITLPVVGHMSLVETSVG